MRFTTDMLLCYGYDLSVIWCILVWCVRLWYLAGLYSFPSNFVAEGLLKNQTEECIYHRYHTILVAHIVYLYNSQNTFCLEYVTRACKSYRVRFIPYEVLTALRLRLSRSGFGLHLCFFILCKQRYRLSVLILLRDLPVRLMWMRIISFYSRMHVLFHSILVVQNVYFVCLTCKITQRVYGTTPSIFLTITQIIRTCLFWFVS